MDRGCRAHGPALLVERGREAPGQEAGPRSPTEALAARRLGEDRDAGGLAACTDHHRDGHLADVEGRVGRIVPAAGVGFREARRPAGDTAAGTLPVPAALPPAMPSSALPPRETTPLPYEPPLGSVTKSTGAPDACSRSGSDLAVSRAPARAAAGADARAPPLRGAGAVGSGTGAVGAGGAAGAGGAVGAGGAGTTSSSSVTTTALGTARAG
jgi:hypothetical protein